jgi:hypothetical protein
MATKQQYSNEDIATLMGVAHVKHGNQLPTIWDYVDSYRGKSIGVVWRQLYACMKQWSHDRQIRIKMSIYLEGATIKALVELKFNPGEGVAHLSSADKRLSIMCCQGHTSTETERIWDCKDALSATTNTRQLDKLLQLSKRVTRAPADNFRELKINIATFMSLVWELFGLECNYYKGLCNIYGDLDLKEVMAQKQVFTAEHCHRITWAIIDDIRTYFDNVKTTSDFRRPNEPVFPQSYLIDILKNVCSVECSNFPNEWKQKVKSTNNNHGARTAGIGARQEREGKRLTQGTGLPSATP